MTVDIDDRTLTERLVLLAAAKRVARGEDSVTSAELQSECQDCLDDLDADVLGRLHEADVTRALNELAAASLVEETVQQRSAVGKGRPTYTLAFDTDATLEALSADDRLRPAVERLTE